MIRARSSKQQTATAVSLPAPVGGLNARDSVAAMSEVDALTLENWFPQATSVDMRRGYADHATFTGQCESILIYQGLTTTEIFPCVVNGSTRSIFNGTAAGALSVPVVGGAGATVEALTSTRFDYVNYGTTGGQFLLAVNGADDALRYDGTTWTVSTITGVDTDDLFTLAIHGERIWLAQSNTFDIWYLPVNAITGAVTRLNLASLFEFGGSMSNIVTWSADSSSSLSTFIAFVSTLGEVVVYQGTDPSSAATFARVSQFKIGRPICKGQRAWARLGADALIITVDGVVSMVQQMIAGRELSTPVSDKIRNEINADALIHGARFGWSIVAHTTGKKLIVNVPTNENVATRQWVMNIETKAWCKFTQWDAFSWAVSRDTLYFGGDGILATADTGTDDNGDEIIADAKQAFSYFGARGRNKSFTMARPTLLLDGPVDLALDINLDYGDRAPQYLTPISGGTGDPWGDGFWDAVWSGAAVIYNGWQAIGGVGIAAAPRIRVQSGDVTLSWLSTDLVFEYCGIL